MAKITIEVATDKVTIADSATIPPLNITERSAPPTSSISGDIYLDDGTNTASGSPGWRRYTGSAWEDIGTAGGSSLTIVSKSTTYTANWGELVKADVSGGDWTLTLPAASGNNGEKIIVKIMTGTANTLTIEGNGAETIDGNANITLDIQHHSLTFVSDGTNVLIV